MAKLVMDRERGVFCVELKGNEQAQEAVDLAHEAGSVAEDGTLYVRFPGAQREWVSPAELERKLAERRAQP